MNLDNVIAATDCIAGGRASCCIAGRAWEHRDALENRNVLRDREGHRGTEGIG